MSTEEIVQRTRLLDSEIKVALRAGERGGAERGRSGAGAGRLLAAGEPGRAVGAEARAAESTMRFRGWRRAGGAAASPAGGERTLPERGPAGAEGAVPQRPGCCSRRGASPPSSRGSGRPAPWPGSGGVIVRFRLEGTRGDR